MPKRRRLLTPQKHKPKPIVKEDNDYKVKEVLAARGRLKGALLEALEPQSGESDSTEEPSQDDKEMKESDDEDSIRKKSPVRQAYVLKLFDRSVDLSQFEEDSPLYPICRAWMINQPKANYREICDYTNQHTDLNETDKIELPGPEGPPISRIPDMLPEQLERSKDNINLNYEDESALPSRSTLLRAHLARWSGVRAAWLQRAALVETRYSQTQDLLYKININS